MEKYTFLFSSFKYKNILPDKKLKFVTVYHPKKTRMKGENDYW